MQKIVISNFAAIKKIELNLEDSLTTVIGAQASGKSTLAKTIYFCRKIKDYLLEFLVEPDNFYVHENERYLSFLKFIRKQFMGCFGTTKHMNDFRIDFYYDNRFVGNAKEERRLSIYLDKAGYAKIDFSKYLYFQISNLITEASTLYGHRSTPNELKIIDNILTDFKTRQMIKQHFVEIIKGLFCDEYEIIYVPAGRSVLATFSDQLYDLDNTKIELPLKEFMQMINLLKKKFGTKIPEIIQDYTKTISGQIKNDDVDRAYNLIRSILKGDYVNDTDGEKIFINDRQWIKLMFASSGQQEVLWILLLIFVKILENKKVFLVLEEPEAHLFPYAQRTMIELVSLMINSTQSQVLITTHSPYILTSINLLTYSGKVENNKKTPLNKIIVPRQLRINPTKMNAFMIECNENFNFFSIKDKEEQLIDTTQIDRISEVIIRETEEIMDLEILYDL